MRDAATVAHLHGDHEQKRLDVEGAAGRLSHATCSPRSRADQRAVGVRCHGAPTKAVLEMLEEILTGRRRSTIRQEGQETQGRQRKVMGSPPGLQELRPAGEHRQGAGRQALGSWAATSPAAIGKSWKRSTRTERVLRQNASSNRNVDFYTGVIYRALGFPTRIVHGAVRAGRLPGDGHWREMHDEAGGKTCVRARSTKATPSETTKRSAPLPFPRRIVLHTDTPVLDVQTRSLVLL